MKDQQSLFSECRGVENHSRVADCTRLILIVGCAWGQSRNARSRDVRTRKHTAGLEWFGPPERNTLRPLCVVLLVSP